MFALPWLAALVLHQAPACDLDVLYIQRTPRYAAYLPSYGLPGKENQPLLTRPGSAEVMPMAEADRIQRWPKPGQTVTYTAVVENKGSKIAPAFDWLWTVDGRPAMRGRTSRALKPGEWANVAFELKWVFKRREIRFQVDPKHAIPQASTANDSRSVWTHAKLLVCQVDRVTYESFARNRNFLGTSSFEDWCQAHADKMNEFFARSAFPGTAPQGILDRVSVDLIEVLDDDKAHEARWRNGPPIKEGWDGAWWFGRNPDCSKWAAGWDWGLIHEWGHQLGLTDLYVLDVAPESNQALDGSGAPLLIGHMSHFRGTMMHGHGNVLFSEDQAIALNHQLWRRRGYYGDYYYSLPEICRVRVADAAGMAVAGAKLTFWQRDDHGPGFSGSPTFAGVSEGDGVFTLPNRPAPRVVTHGDFNSGYALRPNPFGLINVVGGNGVFLVRIEARGQTDFAWLEIPQFNIAKAKAQSAVVLETTLPPAGAEAPPASPRVQSDSGQVTIEGPSGGFAVYRADPSEYRWKEVGRSDGRPFSEKLPGSGLYRYAVASLANGRVSARSHEVGVASMVEPWGLATAADGAAYVRDRANGQTLWIRPDGSAVGYVGSVHWHFEGSFDHAIDSGGQLYVAQWPHGYDPTHTLIRKIDPRGKGQEYGRTDLSYGEWKDSSPGRFREPMGVWVDPADGSIVVADTGNDRVQILDAAGKVRSVVAGFTKPHKALIASDKLVVADTGAHRVVVLEGAGSSWRHVAVLEGFEQPVYLCRGVGDDIWVADRGVGRVFAVNSRTWRRSAWQFPPAGRPKIEDLRGIAYDARHGDLLYVDARRKIVGRRHVLD